MSFYEMDEELRNMTGQSVPTFYYVFNGGYTCRVRLTGANIQIESQCALGKYLITFYNYFEKHAYICDGQKFNGARALFLNDSQSKINDVIAGCALCSEFHARQNEVQNCFNDISVSMQTRPRNVSVSEQLESNLFFMEDTGKGEYAPRKFVSMIAMLENQPVTVYVVTSLTELLALEYFFSFFGPYPQSFSICEECKRMYIQKRNDSRFCSYICQKKSLDKFHKRSPYWIKYRSLQQRYNKKVSKGYCTSNDIGAIVNTVYREWQVWASEQERLATEQFLRWGQRQQKITLDAAISPSIPTEKQPDEPMSETTFALMLKKRWQELSAIQIDDFDKKGADYYESCDLCKILKP